QAEIARVQDIGVPADKIFYSSPCKQVAHIKYAAGRGVQLMAFDNEVELSKVARSHPRARVLLGIAAESSPSAHPSMAFGTTLESCRRLLETAKEQAVEVVGVSFRLGSCALEPQAFAQSVAAAQLACEMGTELGYRMRLLDIGGGFPGTEDSRARFEEMAAAINSALDLYFPAGCGVEIIARPGRYYVTSAFTLAASITAREEVPAEQPGSDGRWDGGTAGRAPPVCPSRPEPSPCSSPEEEPCPERPSRSSSLRGPAGRAEDRIADGLQLPELQVGDWLLFEDVGAYAVTTPHPLGEPPRPPITYAMSRLAWKAVQLFQGKRPQTEDDRESVCAPLSCGWEMSESLCVTPLFAPASII
ncbi:AZIN2 inhibitor, partial [Ardeotis kori]|nr:AZIN2 inhibitor [Ardeotis kori]